MKTFRWRSGFLAFAFLISSGFSVYGQQSDSGQSLGDMARKLVYLVGIDKVKFRRPVVPGDRLDMETRMLRARRNIGWVSVEANVAGKLACSGEMMFSIGADGS